MEFALDSNLSKATAEATDIIQREFEKGAISVQLFGKLTKDGRTEEIKSSVLYCRKYNNDRIHFLFDSFTKGETEFSSITLVVKPIKPRQRPCPNCQEVMRADNITQHLKTCAKKGMCLICEKHVKDVKKHMETCSVKTYPCRVCSEDFNTGARRTAHEKKCRVALTKRPRVEGKMQYTHHNERTAINGLFRIVTIEPLVKTDDFIGFLEEELEHIKEILEFRIKPALKFYLTLKLGMVKLTSEERKIVTFNTSATPLLEGDDAIVEIKKHVDRLDEKVDKYIQNGSGWIVEDVKQLDVMIAIYNPIYTARSYYKSPKPSSSHLSESDDDNLIDWISPKPSSSNLSESDDDWRHI